MKTKTKKAGIFTAMAAALIMAALLVTNCVEPVNSSNVSTQRAPAPVGYGYLTLNITDSTARTVLPTAPTIVDYQIAIYNSIATGTDILLGESGALNPIQTGTNVTYALPEETYRVVVNARITGGLIVATGEKTGIVLSEAGISTGTIVLKEIDNDGNGSFSWDITSPSNAEIAALTITNLETNLPFGIYNNYDLILNDEEDTTSDDPLLSLTSGYYKVAIVFSAASGLYPKTVTDYVHIYQNQSTTWTVSGVSDLAATQHEITFDPGDGDWSSGQEPDDNPLPVNHGSTIDDAEEINDPDEANNPGEYFVGWFTQQNGAGTAWLLDTYRVLSSRTLYGFWKEEDTGDLEITLYQYTHPTDKAAISGTRTYDILELTANTADDIIITADLTDFTFNSWLLDGTEISTSTPSSGFSFSNANATLTITPGNITDNTNPLTQVGEHYITLVTTDSDGKYWAGSVKITVTNN